VETENEESANARARPCTQERARLVGARGSDAAASSDGADEECDNRKDEEDDSHPQQEVHRVDQTTGDGKDDCNHGDDDEEDAHVMLLLSI
jgi:hypothetical protein